jgi:glycosyltransferase involved in cell wall biosynthesis
MTETPKITVVIPTYNHLTYLPKMVDDICAQTRRDWEMVIVNDGSVDGTKEWLDGLTDPRIRVVHTENRGVFPAVNTGVAAARGEFLTVVSSDNRCPPYFLEALAAALESDDDFMMAYSPYYQIDGDDNIFSFNFDNAMNLRELVTNCPRGNTSYLYRRSVHDRIGPYAGPVADTAFYARIAAEMKIVFVVEPTHSYRVHGDQWSKNVKHEIAEAIPLITLDFIDRQGGEVTPEALIRLYPGLAQDPERIPYAAADFAMHLFALGFRDKAISLLRDAIRRATVGNLYRPVVNLITCAVHAGLDPQAEVEQAVAANDGLSAQVRTAAAALATAQAAWARATGSTPALLLESQHPLRRAETPYVFSYAAWKAGLQKRPAVR